MKFPVLLLLAVSIGASDRDDSLLDLCANSSFSAIQQFSRAAVSGVLRLGGSTGYKPGIDCRVNLVPLPDYYTIVFLESLDIRTCDLDTLEVSGSGNKFKIFRFCDRDLPVRTYIRTERTGEVVKVHFRSANVTTGNFTGFVVKYVWRSGFVVSHLYDVILISSIFVIILIVLVVVPLGVLKLINCRRSRQLGEISQDQRSANRWEVPEIEVLSSNPPPPPYNLSDTNMDLPTYSSLDTSADNPPPYCTRDEDHRGDEEHHGDGRSVNLDDCPSRDSESVDSGI